jgi:hypothetical protein
MMSTNIELGTVSVFTTENRGYTPEEIAERAVTRILRVQNKDELQRVLLKYLHEARESERMNVRQFLIKNGFSDAASRLGD